MHLDDASVIFARLKAAFPGMALDEAEAEVLLKELALLHDPSVLNEAVDNLIRSEERFPTIAKVRLAYRAVNEARVAHRQALERATPAVGDAEIPEWVQVWFWRRKKTETARQAANTSARGPVEERPPVPMRAFPQEGRKDTDSYSMEEYEQLRQAWIAAGSPRAESAGQVIA